jgi:hypothetical protein
MVAATTTDDCASALLPLRRNLHWSLILGNLAGA